jgi:hypothetical protein
VLHNGHQAEVITHTFDYKHQMWSKPSEPQRSTSALVIYARVDGGFSVWDQARASQDVRDSQRVRTSQRMAFPLTFPQTFGEGHAGAYHFTAETLWNSLHENGNTLCNGLVDDWVRWQYQPNQRAISPFAILTRVIEHLAPHPQEWMKPGEPTRVSLRDVRDIPTIDLPYGTVPVIYASAGMQRILGLAYLLVWTWYEHTQAARLLNRDPSNRLILLMDEVEAHLHPRWQRSLLPALLRIVDALQQELRAQIIVTTHSPLVLASVEPHFDEAQDKLFLLGYDDQDPHEVTLSEIDWAKQGDAVGWLTSEVFGLKQARSQEAELAIEAAEALMRGAPMTHYPECLRTKEQIQRELRRLLPGHDPFWPRWGE